MKRKNSFSVLAIFILMIFCLQIRKFKTIIFAICIILIAFILMFYINKKIKHRKKEQIDMRKINYDKVYEYLTTIPNGKVVTYGMIAEYLGDKKLARTVGNILHQNPDGEKYPCYKVVSSEGKLSENYTFGGIEKQKELLLKENIEVKENKVDLNIYKWNV